MWQRFTERARVTIVYAQEEAAKMGTCDVDTEHMLLGLLHEEQGDAFQLLRQIGVDVGVIRNAARQQGRYRQNKCQASVGEVWPPPPRTEGYLEQNLQKSVPQCPPLAKNTQEMKLAKAGKHVIDFAYDEARRWNNGSIGPQHLLLGMIREGKGIAAQVLKAGGVDLEQVRQGMHKSNNNVPGAPKSSWLKTLFTRK